MAQSNRTLRVVSTQDEVHADRDRGAEQDWVQRAIQGERQAVVYLLRQVTPSVERTVAGVLGPGDPDGDDLVQEVLVAFVRALPAFRGQGSVPSFASGIATRITLTALRRRGRSRPLVEFVDHPSAGTLPAAVARRQLLSLLRHALRELSLEQAETVHLRWILGHDLVEVAHMTRVSVHTVRSRLRLARRHLERRLQRDPRWGELLELAREDL